MPTALSDPSRTLYVILIIVTLVMAGIMLRRQKRGDVIRFFVAVAALVAVFLIDRFWESPREQMFRKLQEMERASQEKNWDGMFQHVSDAFEYQGPLGAVIKKPMFRQWVKAIEAEPAFKGFVILDMDRADFREENANTANVGFLAKPKDIPAIEYESFIIATFTREADGEWRMTSFKRYNKKDQNYRGPQIAIPRLD